ncbi:Isoprenylcysteine carboxyl methyltransferase family-domain-containing protein [Gaertneriomyces semiglobifer]|nr:Isoprenylcysteine carboxyl methyltransferase family-domain-containing protein [Gaertneriomyces semiglobifer]
MRQDSRGGLFDGRHTPQNIAAYAYLLGCTHGAGIVVGWFSNAGRGLALFFALLALFHFLEYLCTAMYRSDVKLQAFLLNHSREYHLAMIAGVVEYSVEAYFVPSLKVFCWWNWLALFGVLLAQTLRSTAMITAGRNFTHIIADDRDPAHTLVTTGVYSIFRHPAYTAFFYWGVLMQVMLANPLCSLAYAVALYSFFESRIPYEEITLINFFGDDYDRYRSKTHVLIPGIR